MIAIHVKYFFQRQKNRTLFSYCNTCYAAIFVKMAINMIRFATSNDFLEKSFSNVHTALLFCAARWITISFSISSSRLNKMSTTTSGPARSDITQHIRSIRLSACDVVNASSDKPFYKQITNIFIKSVNPSKHLVAHCKAPQVPLTVATPNAQTFFHIGFQGECMRWHSVKSFVVIS